MLRSDRYPIRRVVGGVLLRLPFDAGKVIKRSIRIQDYSIGFHSSSLFFAFWCNPQDREFDYEFIRSYLKNDDIYVDVGANIGTTLIPAAKIVKEGLAIGVEPHPKIFLYLRENVALNEVADNVLLYNCALGETRGNVTFSDKRNDDINAITIKGKGIAVPMQLLDDIGGKYKRINLLKIDVEGYEKFVCEGGTKTLAKTDCIYFEVFQEHYSAFGYSMKDMFLLLRALGFELFLVDTVAPRTIITGDRAYDLPTSYAINMLGIKDTRDFIERTGWRIEGDAKRISKGYGN